MIDEDPHQTQQPMEAIVSTIYNGAHVQHQVRRLIDTIIKEAWEMIEVNRLVKNKMPSMVNHNMFGKINEVNDLLFFNQFQLIMQEQQEAQPAPLLVDSLLPISADIDPENHYKNKLKIPTQLTQSQVKPRLGNRLSVTERRQPYVKLDTTEPEEEDGFTKQLRKVVVENQFKADNQKKSRERKQQIKLDQMNSKQKRRDEKVSYDYQGNMISLRSENKTNLISKTVGCKTPGEGKIAKQAVNDPSPTKVNGQKPGLIGKEGKAGSLLLNSSAAPSKRKDQVQFSQVKSLAQNVKTNPGVRYTYEGKSIEEKRKQRTMVEIKKTLSQNKLTKEEYHKLKALNTNREDLEERLKKSTVNESGEGTMKTLGSVRSKSEARLTGWHSRQKSKATIHISNEGLKQRLLEAEKPVIKLPEEEHHSQAVSSMGTNNLMLGTIDNFNVEYMRTGGVGGQPNTARQFFTHRQSSNTQLPKIQHTTIYSKNPPKGRERIKDSNDILRQMRKRFEEKLRV